MQTHATVSYQDDRYALITDRESFIPQAYIDSRGIPTIGVGFNLKIHLDRVLEELGFDVLGSELTGQAAIDEGLYILQIKLLVTQPFAPDLSGDGTGDSSQLLQGLLENVMSDRTADPDYPIDFARRPEFALDINEVENRAVFDDLMEGYVNASGSAVPGVEDILDAWLNDDRGDTQSPASTTPELLVPDNHERLALLSIAWQNPSILEESAKLHTALRNDDRAEAWYEIRYNTNKNALAQNPPGDAAGIANRRYHESDEFDLFDAGPIADDDARDAYRMFTRHYADRIEVYESRYDPVDPNAGSEPLSVLLEPARQYLEATYGHGQSIAWDHIFVGEDSSTLYFRNSDSDSGTFTLVGTNGSDLVFGESGADTLRGGGGNDVLDGGTGKDLLVGEDGDDILNGGLGNDLLLGGTGSDTYIFAEDDGFDVVTDGDGVGRIVFAGTDLTGEKTLAWTFGAEQLQYTDGNGFTYRFVGQPGQVGTLYIKSVVLRLKLTQVLHLILTRPGEPKYGS